MPTRILRDGILTSESVNSLSLEAELFYRRLMSVTDDHGRFFAHAAILRAHCFPLRLEGTPELKVSRWLEECARAHLVRIYSTNGKNYLEISNFRQRTRSDSKFPAPCPSNDRQMTAEAPRLARALPAPCPSNDRLARGSAAVVGGGVVVGDEGVCEVVGVDDALALLKERHPKKKNLLAADNALFGIDPSAWPEILKRHKVWCATEGWQKQGGRFAPQLADWLKNGRQDPAPVGPPLPPPPKPETPEQRAETVAQIRETWSDTPEHQREALREMYPELDATRGDK